MSATDIFKLKRPCAKCPFRTDVHPYLHRERAVEIARSIAEGGMFACHQTTEYDEDSDDMTTTDESKFCAGALIAMEHQEASNQHTRIAERLGLYDPTKLDMSAPVHKSFVSFIDHHGQDEEEVECCNVCDAGCEAPAGYLVNGMVVRGEEGETHYCPTCGEAVCDNCSDDEGVCNNCAEWEDD